jgi:transcriptional regulator with XRE-family HTH domain
MSARREIPEEMRQLGWSLRRLRTDAGLTGQQLADQTGLSQSTVSRMELGQAMPAITDINRWADATGATTEMRAQIIKQAENAAVRVISWKKSVDRGMPALQRDVQNLEAVTATVLNFQPVIIPGLLQVADYTRRVILSGYPGGRDDLAATVKARMDRQAILKDDTKRLEFIIAETALRWRIGPLATMRAQIDRIMRDASLPSVTVGIIPLSTEVSAWHIHGFQIIDDPTEGDATVRTETLTRGLSITDHADVERYREAYGVLRDTAVFGQEANEILAAVMADFS